MTRTMFQDISAPRTDRGILTTDDHAELCMDRCKLLLILATLSVLFGLQQMLAQADHPSVPMSTVKPCGMSSGTVSGANSAEALALLKTAVSKMDVAGSYSASRAFTITGSLSDLQTKTSTAPESGTFTFKEDHSVPNGAQTHTSVVNGRMQSIKILNGQFITPPVSMVNGTTQPAKLPFVPKSFYFPLAILSDEISNPAIVASFIADQPNSTKSSAFAGLRHIQTVNSATSASKLYEVEDWYIDPSTSLPVFVGYQLPTTGKVTTCVEAYAHFSTFATVGKSYVPTTITQRRGAGTVRTATIQTLGYTAQ